MFNFFKKRKKQKEILSPKGYMSPTEIKDVESQHPVPELKIEKNGHKKIILLDDNSGSLIFLRSDFDYIARVQQDLKNDKINKIDEEFIELLKKEEIYEEFLKIPFEFFDIVSAEGELGAFTIKKYLEQDGQCDFAILDIILGGVQIENGHIVSLNGIDVADLIWKKFPECKIKFFSGCVLNKKSEETIQFRNITGREIKDFVMFKDPNIIGRRIEIVKLFLENE